MDSFIQIAQIMIFLNLPLWASFYNNTDLSHSTSTTVGNL